ncbi:Hypothetical protein R9X50_00041600 [Acrodontium crateriforme]|uniref:Uncharacterized protein n=1 Tax=Acrodontium crateriforme TaxID=150365 RepID=A0AAQ3LY10_9PEZI|nr:Hypothetical protein R9X50_00041600 [Acrodontium crateriforme]
MSSDGLNPTGPSQPSRNQVYETTGNAASKEPTEQRASQFNAQDNSASIDQRVPQKQTYSIDEATPSSLGRGIRGVGPGEEAHGKTAEDVGRNQELDAEQMAAPGEGKVAGAVENKPGATGAEQSLESDLDRKKAEQSHLRQKMKEAKSEEFDVGGVLGQRGGPAADSTH